MLNALAQVGNSESRRTIIRALEDHANDPEIITAGVAALYKLSPLTAEADLRKRNFPAQMVTLAALQHVRPEELKLAGLPLNVQKADSEAIKAALVVVGLDRAPPNMFDPNFSNGEIIKVVGRHDNAMVAQYSVWAITENRSLNFDHMGIELSEVASQPDNVRGWVYRLIAMSEQHCLKHLDFVVQASKDGRAEARLGLAHGIRETFFNQLVPIVLDWLTSELDAEVRQEILDHVITHAGKSQLYREHAVDAYRRAGPADRERMRGTAAQTVLFPSFRQMDFQSEGELFVTNINFNNNQIGQIGAVGGAGSVTNSGDIIFPPHVVDVVRGELAKAGTTIEGMAIPEAEKRELANAIAEAYAYPNSGTVRRVIAGLSKASSVVTAIAGAEDTLNQIIQGITKLIGLN